jgi:UTP--glucose-1-phosphate uridylyltransferase
MVQSTVMKTIRKAIITTAGFGTRFLPVTKTIQKEMLPILDRPLVDYVVEDCIKAGIEEIIFVIREGERQIQDYYSENPRLFRYLDKMGKAKLYSKVEKLHTQAKYTFVIQKESDPYGTAVPVKLAQPHVENEDAFLVFMGDDFIYQPDGKSNAKAMIELFNSADVAGVASCVERPTELLHKYGVAVIEVQNGIRYLKDLVEKPAPGTAPSNLANISKYVLTPQVFELLKDQPLNPQSGELYITDTVLNMAKQTAIAIHVPDGEYLDGGYPLGWLRANLMVAKNNPELKDELANIVREAHI